MSETLTSPAPDNETPHRRDQTKVAVCVSHSISPTASLYIVFQTKSDRLSRRDANQRLSADHPTRVTPSLCSANVLMSSPFSASQMRTVLSSEGEAMNRPQGDQAMRPMGPVCPRQMHRSLIPGTTSLPTSMKSLGSSPARFPLVAFFLALRFVMTISLVSHVTMPEPCERGSSLSCCRCRSLQLPGLF